MAKLASSITGDTMTNGVVVVPDSSKSKELAARITVLEDAPSATSPQSYPFTNESSLTITHNLGRMVSAQAYLNTGQQIRSAVSCPDLNTVTIYFSTAQSGTLVLS